MRFLFLSVYYKTLRSHIYSRQNIYNPLKAVHVSCRQNPLTFLDIKWLEVSNGWCCMVRWTNIGEHIFICENDFFLISKVTKIFLFLTKIIKHWFRMVINHISIQLIKRVIIRIFYEFSFAIVVVAFVGMTSHHIFRFFFKMPIIVHDNIQLWCHSYASTHLLLLYHL